MVFHWSLSDSKSPQVSRTLLSILAVVNNAVVWVVSTRPPTSKSSSPFNNPLVTVPKVPIMIAIIFTFMFLSFFNSLARSRYLSFFSLSFSFILWSAGTAKSTILQILFFVVDYNKVCLFTPLEFFTPVLAFFQFYSVVSWNSKVHNFASSLFLLIIIRSGFLAENRWSVCMSKSHRSLCVSFSRTDAGLWIYPLFVW